ncbi:hypothetical protein [Bacillus thuringiensis]|uniref:hypothetical protein n=1 Tax=Bacillus thuringiensis TaxID=1428 RepID=UPI0021D67A90|nr:hypothetical protein [Bacillus thuringiensis]MCU7667606.1 hypothetical protein [Bacillus thuringiensis]
MNEKKLLKTLELHMCKDEANSVNCYSNIMTVRRNPLKGTFSVEFGEFVNGLPAVIIDVVDKEIGNEFQLVSEELFKEVIEIIESHANQPLVLIGAIPLSESWEQALEKHSFVKCKEEEQALVCLPDYNNAEWVFRNENSIFEELFPALKKIELDFNRFIKNRNHKEATPDILFRPFQRKIQSCNHSLMYSLSSLEPLTLKLTVTDYEFDTSFFDNPITSLFKEFHESLRLKWLVEDTVFASSHSLASVHSRGTIKEEAITLQHAALSADWNYDEMDILFKALKSDQFNDYYDNFPSKVDKEESLQLEGFNIKIEKERNGINVVIHSEDYRYVVKTRNGFPFKAEEVDFEKNAL